MADVVERHRERARTILLTILFAFFSLYVINVVGNIEGVSEFLGKRRYLNALWIILCLYLVVSKGKIEWQFFWENVCLIIPISITCLFLYFYHNHAFNLSYVKYVFLFILAGSVACQNSKFRLREFFAVNSLACLIIFFSAGYQILVLEYPVPNGDLNQNIFACMVVAVGNVSFFSLLYKNLNRWDQRFFALCGVLAIWVALRTSCRTAYVTEVVVACLFSFLAYKRLGWSKRKNVVFGVLIILSMFCVIVESPSVTESKFRAILAEILDFSSLGDGETTESSVGLRLAMWKAAFVDLIPKHFFFGIGDVEQINLPALIPNSNIGPRFLAKLTHFHNEGINILVMGGLLLFIVSNWLLYRLFVIAKNEPVQLCLLVGTVAWGITEVAFFHKQFLFVFLSIWFLYDCATRNEQYQEADKSSVLMQCWKGCESFCSLAVGMLRK